MASRLGASGRLSLHLLFIVSIDGEIYEEPRKGDLRRTAERRSTKNRGKEIYEETQRKRKTKVLLRESWPTTSNSIGVRGRRTSDPCVFRKLVSGELGKV